MSKFCVPRNKQKAGVTMANEMASVGFNELVTVEGGNEPRTTSLKVAAAFGKQHKDVLRSIANLECSKGFNERNFAPVEYRDEKGEMRPAFSMTRNGFVFLAMGFTGERAAEFKEGYIMAFDKMETCIKQISERAYAQQSEQAQRILVDTIRGQEAALTDYKAHCVKLQALASLAVPVHPFGELAANGLNKSIYRAPTFAAPSKAGSYKVTQGLVNHIQTCLNLGLYQD